MIIPDLNLLLYAYDATSPFHPGARAWWKGCLSGVETVGIPWLVGLGFVRMWTNPRVFQNPMSVEQATGHVEQWMGRPMVTMLNPGPRHGEIVFRLLREGGRGGNLTTDAHLGALAIENNATVHTTDADFLRFAGVKWKNPLARRG